MQPKHLAAICVWEGFAGAAAALPIAARAQQVERVQRIGVLTYLAAGDAEGQARLAARPA